MISIMTILILIILSLININIVTGLIINAVVSVPAGARLGNSGRGPGGSEAFTCTMP